MWTLTLSLRKVRDPPNASCFDKRHIPEHLLQVSAFSAFLFFPKARIVNHLVFPPLNVSLAPCSFQKCLFYSWNDERTRFQTPRFILNMHVSESEDEVEEIEEQVLSPDVTTEESAAFYNPASW